MLNVEFKLEDALAVSREEGREEGLEEGLERGREEGLEKGLERGLEKGAKELAALIKKGYSVDEALELISKKKNQD
jgi:flagellar biosynthesis/type III secretory pathway protein FliH